MAYNENFTQLAQRSPLKRESTYLPTENDGYDLELKTPENSVNILNGMFDIFNEIEINADSKNLMRGMTETAFFENIMKSPKKVDRIDFAQREKMFTYFLLSTSSDEFQKIISKFCQDFSTGKDATMTGADFKRMLDFMCRKENIGRVKVEKCLKKLVPTTFETCDRLDKALGKQEENELGSYLTNELFQLLQTEDLGIDQEPYVDPIKLLPLLVGFYSKLINFKVNRKLRILQKVMGVDAKGKKLANSESSLYDKFEKLGKTISKKNPVTLKYKDIEDVLGLLKDSSPANLAQQQKDLVLKDLEAKYKYSKKAGDFLKPPVYNMRFLVYLASRVCVRGIKVSDQHAILQELVEWNIVIHAEKLDNDKLSKKFLKFAKKRVDFEKPLSLKSLDNLFSMFAIKTIPTIHRRITDNAFAEYIASVDNKQEFNILDFAEKVNELLVNQAESKLQTYIGYNYGLIAEYPAQTPRNTNFLRQGTSAQEQIFQSNRSSLGGDEQNLAMLRLNHSKTASFDVESFSAEVATNKASNLKTDPRWGTGHKKINSEDFQEQQPSPNLMRRTLTINLPEYNEQQRKKSNSIKTGSKTTMARHNRAVTEPSIFEKSQKSFGEIEERKEEITTEESQPQREYLNSCFVKEALFGSYTPNGGKKRGSRKTQTPKQDQEDEGSVITKETMDGLSEADLSIKSPEDYRSRTTSKGGLPDFSEFMMSYKRKVEDDCRLKTEEQDKTIEENPIGFGQDDIKENKERGFCGKNRVLCGLGECNMM